VEAFEKGIVLRTAMPPVQAQGTYQQLTVTIEVAKMRHGMMENGAQEIDSIKAVLIDPDGGADSATETGRWETTPAALISAKATASISRKMGRYSDILVTLTPSAGSPIQEDLVLKVEQIVVFTPEDESCLFPRRDAAPAMCRCAMKERVVFPSPFQRAHLKDSALFTSSHEGQTVRQTVVEVCVTESGEVTTAKTVVPSNSPLDEQALGVASSLRFVPVFDKEGCPIPHCGMQKFVSYPM
jgi:hypothetical protein